MSKHLKLKKKKKFGPRNLNKQHTPTFSTGLLVWIW